MTDRLDHVAEAHGGLQRWNELDTVSARLAQGGVTWKMVGQKGVLDDVYVTVSLHNQRMSHYPFGAAGRSVFTPDRPGTRSFRGRRTGEHSPSRS